MVTYIEIGCIRRFASSSEVKRCFAGIIVSNHRSKEMSVGIERSPTFIVNREHLTNDVSGVNTSSVI